MTDQNPVMLATGNNGACRLVSTCALAIVMLLAAGCGSVQVQRGKSLATSGVAYAKATADLLDAANDAMIDADSEVFVRSRIRPSALTPERLQDIQKDFDKKNDALVQNTRQFALLHKSLSATENYFLALQDLVDNPQSDATASAVSNLADQLNAVNGAIKGSAATPLLSEAQKTAIGGLTKLVADQVHGAVVAAALKRDAPLIGETLKLQEKLLEVSGSAIRSALIDRNNIFFVDSVEAPFTKQDIGAQWVADRNTYIKARAIGEVPKELQAARDAARQMDEIWRKILSGVYDTGEIAAQIAEIQALTAALVKVKQAEKPKAATQ
jgi:hypothetical protein